MSLPSAASRAARGAALVGSLAICIAFGFLGVGHDVGRGEYFDTRFLFLAGKYWLAGLDPYAPTQVLDVGLGDFHQTFFMGYPPQASLLCMALALGSMRLATVLMDVLNVACLAAISWIGVATIEETVDPSVSTAQRWYVPALVFGNLSTAFVLWIGQTSLVVTAALAASWYCARRDRDVAAGVLLALATIKPPLAMFVALWFLLERRWRLLAAASVAVLVLAAAPLLQHGPIGALRAWSGGIAQYMEASYNALTSRMVFGVRSLLLALGVGAPNLLGLGILATLVLFAFRARVVERDLIGVLVGCGLLFGYAHGYDLAALALVIPAFWCHLRGRPAAAGIALALLVGITFPNSVLERFDSAVLLHARVVLVLAALAWLVVLSAEAARTKRRGSAQLDDAAATVPLRWLPSTSRMP